MTTKHKITTAFVTLISLFLLQCKHEDHTHDANGQHIETADNSNTVVSHDAHEDHEDSVLLTTSQLQLLNIKIDTLSKRQMHGIVVANGQLAVPPQNEAIVTTTMGANIQTIKVMEGDKVSKGDVLASISHPDIISLQSDYLQTYNQVKFLKQEYERQKTLFEANVGSGRAYQKASSEYESSKGLLKGQEHQLQLLGLYPKQIRNGNIRPMAPLRSPIDGFVEKVFIKSGQYVQPQTALIEIVNTEHIHADLMVFEKDIKHIKKGQAVRMKIEALGNEDMQASIYAVGKSFEEGPKALHVHAEIDNKQGHLIPGMYVNAEIITSDTSQWALPEDAVFQENGHHYAFIAQQDASNNWEFTPQEIIVSQASNGFLAIAFKTPLTSGTLFAQSGAYYLMAEMKKSEAEHSH